MCIESRLCLNDCEEGQIPDPISTCECTPEEEVLSFVCKSSDETNSPDPNVIFNGESVDETTGAGVVSG